MRLQFSVLEIVAEKCGHVTATTDVVPCEPSLARSLLEGPRVLFPIWYFLNDQVAFNEGHGKVRDAALCILDKFEPIGPRPDELRLGQRSQGRTLEEQLPIGHCDGPH